MHVVNQIAVGKKRKTNRPAEPSSGMEAPTYLQYILKANLVPPSTLHEGHVKSLFFLHTCRHRRQMHATHTPQSTEMSNSF